MTDPYKLREALLTANFDLLEMEDRMFLAANYGDRHLEQSFVLCHSSSTLGSLFCEGIDLTCKDCVLNDAHRKFSHEETYKFIFSNKTKGKLKLRRFK